jgi:putative membrane protein
MHLSSRLALTTVVASALLLFAVPGAQAAPSAQDQAWMTAAHQGNLAEIAAGQAAVAQASTDTVRELGQMLITDHTTLDANLTAAATELGITLPTAPSPEQQAELNAVAAKSGAAFDSAWVESQIAAHRATLAAGETELATGSEQQVKDLAAAAAPVVQHHLDEALAAAPQFGVPTSVPAGTGGQAASSTRTIGAIVTAAGVLLITLAGARIARRRA